MKAIICGIGTSRGVTARRSLPNSEVLSDELRSALRHALLESDLGNLHNFFHDLWYGDVENVDGPLLHSSTECFLSGGLTTLISSWKGPTSPVSSLCAHQSLGTWPCRQRHDILLADVNVAHHVAQERKNVDSEGWTQHFRITEAFDANSENVDVWWSNHLELHTGFLRLWRESHLEETSITQLRESTVWSSSLLGNKRHFPDKTR